MTTNLPDLADVRILNFRDGYETYVFMIDEKVLAMLRHASDGTFLVCNEHMDPYGMWGFLNSGLEQWLPLQFPSLESWNTHRNCIYCRMDDSDFAVLNLKAEKITRQQWLRQKGKIR